MVFLLVVIIAFGFILNGDDVPLALAELIHKSLSNVTIRETPWSGL
jgi:hypothetical protein